MSGVTTEVERRRAARNASRRAAALKAEVAPPLFHVRPWYMATPYRKFPGGKNAAFDAACKLAARFTDEGICVFSPIIHSHPIAEFTNTLNADDARWVTLQKPFMAMCCGMLFCRLPSWELSDGLKIEEEYFLTTIKRSVIYVDPDSLDIWIPSIKIARF